MKNLAGLTKVEKVASCICLCFLILLSSAPVTVARELVIALKSLEVKPYKIALRSFKKTLKKNGYHLNIEEHVLQEDSKPKEGLLADIKRKSPRLIVTLGSAATSYIAKDIKDTPVVFCMVLNPTASGFIQSMNASGNNLTGASLDIPLETQFEALRSVIPSARKVGVIYNPSETESVIQEATKAAEQIGLELVSIPIISEEEVPEALRTLDGKVDALWSVADSTVFSRGSTKFILLHTLRNKIPFIGLSPAFVKAGALMALATDYQEVGTQCGELAVRILSGDHPSSLPITMPRTITMYLNLNTAEIIGLKIPSDRMKGAVLLR